MSDKPLAKKTLFFYGLSEMPISIASLPLLAFIPNYYVSDLGLDFAAVALVMLLARSFDAVTDPLIGFLSDRILSLKNPIKGSVTASKDLAKSITKATAAKSSPKSET